MKNVNGTGKTLALLLALFFCATACEQAPPGPGETGEEQVVMPPAEAPADAVEIKTVTDLKNIDRTYQRSKSYKLMNDITLTSWTPICETYPFTGAFYGMNHTITITGGRGGIFAGMGDSKAKVLAMVRDLTVNVTANKMPGSDGRERLGGIAGYVERSLIENCAATVNLTLTGTDHNASAGGIVGMMGSFSTVRGCTASGTITLSSDETGGLMVYAGGIAGYSGTPGLAGDGESGCLIERSSWTGGSVNASGGYPYSGGVVGHNYTGAAVKRCSAAGSVTSTGGDLPYAGGLAGYNSGYVKGTGSRSLIENCYSTADVRAVSSSLAALAGGIAGANPKHALISKCYATGSITVRVAGDSDSTLGGSLGVKKAANAGGIAGSQYYSETQTVPNATITGCAALNSGLAGDDSATGAVWNIYRIAGAGSDGEDRGVWRNNIAWSAMPVTPSRSASNSANGKDGADCEQKPAQSVYAGLGWDFAAVWRMDDNGYPVLR
jgi:hypothetical protein